MSKVVRLMVALTIALFAAQVAVAKPSSKPTKTVSSKPVKATQLKSTSPKSTTTKVSKPSKPTKTTTTKASKPTKTTTSAKTTKTEKAVKPAKTTKSSSTELAQTTKTKGNKSTTTASTSTTSTAAGTTTTTPGGAGSTETEHLGPEMNSKLSKKLTEDSKFTARMMEKLNLTDSKAVQEYAAGFKNWGQFNAAVNTSERLGIPFNDLKAAMTGWTLPNTTTGDATQVDAPILSLGQAQKAFRDGTLPTYPAPDATPTTTSTSTKTTSGTK